jgi:hypothetical protein
MEHVMSKVLWPQLRQSRLPEILLMKSGRRADGEPVDQDEARRIAINWRSCRPG